jgi:hypothetical protein
MYCQFPHAGKEKTVLLLFRFVRQYVWRSWITPMDEPEFKLSYTSFRSFVECAGREATHCVKGDQYLRPVLADGPCYSKLDSALLLCDHCLAFWWQCRENHDLATWETALVFRNQHESNQVNKLFASCDDDLACQPSKAKHH